MSEGFTSRRSLKATQDPVETEPPPGLHIPIWMIWTAATDSSYASLRTLGRGQATQTISQRLAEAEKGPA